MPEAICYLYDIISPDWDLITPDQIDRLYTWMVSSFWFGPHDNRMGFVNVVRFGAVLGGFFSHEGSRESKQYSDDKTPQERYEASFQEVFFAIFMDAGQLVLQSKRVYDYVDLGMEVIRQDFLRVLADGFKLARVRVGSQVLIEEAGGERSQEELLLFFRSNRVIEVEISKLSNSSIPENITDIFNPREEWVPTMRGIVADSLKRGMDYFKAKADDKPSSDLGHTPMVYALAVSGQIERVEAEDVEGKVVYREKHEKAELKIEIPASSNMTPEILQKLFERLDIQGRRDSARFRRQQRKAMLNRGTLFEQDDSSQKG
jgi:hypothetical protein